MSHFTVMVIGENVDEQLAPFHEFECTGVDDEYVREVDETKQARKDYAKRDAKYKKYSFAKFCEAWYGKKPVRFGEKPNLAGDHKYGYVLLDKKGNVVKVVDRTNPETKWDWFQIGGRWSGFFKLKAGQNGNLGKPGVPQQLDPDYEPPEKNRADQCRKGAIDIEGMRQDKAERAAKEYDLFVKVTDGLPKHAPWEIIRKKHGQKNIDVARKEYHAQPVIEALRKNKETVWFEADDFLCTREEYIDAARRDAISTFAVVKDGKWYEKGEMGWWGIVTNEMAEDGWNQQFSKLIDDLTDDTLLTVVDCHI